MKKILVSAMAALFALAWQGSAIGEEGVYDGIYDNTAVTEDGVKEISYEEFMGIRNSEEDYVLFDVLSPESYSEGHIEGSESFPMGEINEESADDMLDSGSNAIVYCGGFSCRASTRAAQMLDGLGYKVLDYKGGLEEWQERGNSLVKD